MVSLKYLPEILGIVSKTHLPCYIVNVVTVVIAHKACSLFHPYPVQIVRKPDSFFLNKLFAEVTDTHKQVVFSQPLKREVFICIVFFYICF